VNDGPGRLDHRDVEAAARRIDGFVLHTATLRSDTFDTWLGVSALAKAEHRQHAGAFKYRGATNAVQALPDDLAARGVGAHSSGNHAAALALAARTRGIPCVVVMPRTATRAKRNRVMDYGARVVECEASEGARVATLQSVIAETGVVEIHPFDNDFVIAGAGTAVLELLADHPAIDVVVTPVGGGGLLSGSCLAAPARVRMFGAEPSGADDAARSLAAGHIVPQTSPDTIADGLLTSLAPRTFAIIRERAERIVRVTDDETRAAMGAVRDLLGERIEPSSAVAVAAVRRAVAQGSIVRDSTVGIVLSGGNLDAESPNARPASTHPSG
jgi:threonine dehydratase